MESVVTPDKIIIAIIAVLGFFLSVYNMWRLVRAEKHQREAELRAERREKESDQRELQTELSQLKQEGLLLCLESQFAYGQQKSVFTEPLKEAEQNHFSDIVDTLKNAIKDCDDRIASSKKLVKDFTDIKPKYVNEEILLSLREAVTGVKAENSILSEGTRACETLARASLEEIRKRLASRSTAVPLT